MVPMKDTKRRLSVALDEATIDEAMRLVGARSKRETIARALGEMIKARRRKALSDSIGSGIFGTTERQLRGRRHQKHGQ